MNKGIKNIAKKVSIIVTVFMVSITSFPAGYSYGVSATEAAKQVADFAKAFVDEGVTKGNTFSDASISYSKSVTGKRAANNDNIFVYTQSDRTNGGNYFFGKKKVPSSGTYYSGSVGNITYKSKLGYDCSAFVSWIWDYTTGTEFNYTTTHSWETTGKKYGFENVGTVSGSDYSNLEPGDVLNDASSHIVLYVGNNEIVHSSPGQLYHWNRETDNYTCSGYTILRLKKDVDEINTSLTWPDGSTLGVASSGSGEYTLEDDQDVDDGKFEYYGLPAEGKYQGNTNIGKWLIDFVKQIMDYLIGIMILQTKSVIVGWTALIEMWLSSVLDTITGDDTEGWWSPTKLNVDSSRSVTVENIVLNKVPIFDINLFNFDIDTTVTGTGRPKNQEEK